METKKTELTPKRKDNGPILKATKPQLHGVSKETDKPKEPEHAPKKPRVSRKENLKIAENYPSSWKKSDGVRELLSNWWDGCLESSLQQQGNDDPEMPIVVKDSSDPDATFWRAFDKTSKKKLGHMKWDHTSNVLTLRNELSQLKIEHLTVGYSSKSRNAIGTFGEGLKLGALALVRNGSNVTAKISANGGLVLKFYVDLSSKTSQKTLHVSNKDRKDQGRHTDRGTTITITEVTDQDLILSNFLFLSASQERVIDLKHVQLWPDKPGMIFRKGIFVCKDLDLYYGYNIISSDVELVNRDRCSVDDSKLCSLLMKSWSARLSENWELFVAMVEAKPYSKEVLRSSWMTKNAIQKLAQKELPPILLLTIDPKIEKNIKLAKEIGLTKQLLVCPQHLFRALHPICDSFETYQKKALSQSEDTSLDKWRKEDADVDFLFNNLPEIPLDRFRVKECDLPIDFAMSNYSCILNKSYLTQEHLHEEAPCPTAGFGNCHCVLHHLVGIIEENFKIKKLKVTIMHLLMTDRLNQKDEVIQQLRAEIAKLTQGSGSSDGTKKRKADWNIGAHIQVTNDGKTETGTLKHVFTDDANGVLFMVDRNM